VNALPVVSIPNYPSVCLNVKDFPLTGATPAGSGGMYSGIGVVNGRFDPLLAGVGVRNITYRFTDINGCTDSATTALNVFALPQVALSTLGGVCDNAPVVNLTQGTVTANGGLSYYHGPGVSGTQFNPVVAGPGSHQIWFGHTDTNGCADSVFRFIAVNPAPLVSFNSIPHLCENNSVVTFHQGQFASFNGLDNRYYRIGQNIPTDSMSFRPDTLGAGTYTVHFFVTDTMGCRDSATQNLSIDTVPIVSLASLPDFCNNENSVALSGGLPAGGGTGQYYGLGVINGRFYPQFILPGNSSIYYTFTNLRGCSDTAMQPLSIKASPQITLNTLPPICEDIDTITLNGVSVVAGAGYGYFKGVGVYADSLFLQDSVGIGTYQIKYVYRDTTGTKVCMDSATQQITVHPLPVVSALSQSPLCLNESKVLNFGIPAGGQYLDSAIQAMSGNRFVAGAFGVGTHRIIYRYTDFNGCSDTATRNIQVFGSQTVRLTLPTTRACTGGGQMLLSGGKPVGGSFSGFGVFNGIFYPSSTGVGVHAVYYSYTDTNNCAASDTAFISVSEQPVLNVSPGISACEGIDVELYAASPQTLNYKWNTGDLTDTIRIIATSTANYIVTATDTNGCSADAQVRVEVYPAMALMLNVQSTDCGESVGSASVSVSGGLPPYRYLWTTGSNQNFINNLSAGLYEVTVTDANLCENSEPAVINNQNAPQVNVNTITDASCHNSADGSIDVDVLSAYKTIGWSNGDQTEDISGLSAGTYYVTVSDENDCQAIFAFDVQAPDPVSVAVQTTRSGCGAADGGALAMPQGGVGGYAFAWSNGQSTDSLKAVQSGVYSLTVTDLNNCTSVAQVAISDSGAPLIHPFVSALPSCNLPIGQVQIDVSHHLPYQVLWNTTDTLQVLGGLAAGNYAVSVTDTAGCRATATVDLNNAPTPVPAICMTTIDTTTGMAQVLWKVGAPYARMNILARNTADQFLKINDLNPTVGIYTDTASIRLPRAHGYRLSALDSCGETTANTAEQRAIYLTVTPSRSNDNVMLRWTHYRGFTVTEYEVFRKSGASFDYVGSVYYPSQEFALNEPEKDVEEIRYIVRVRAPENCGPTPFYEYTYSNFTRNLGTREVGVAPPLRVESYGLYPNPNNGSFHLTMDVEGQGELMLTITDMQGRMVWHSQRDAAAGRFDIDVALEDISTGMYQLRIESSGGVIIDKIQVVR
jgi:hypothetical protein